MSSPTEATTSWSPSVNAALLWASGCASLRLEGGAIGTEDLFLGLLLAHPDEQGEVWRLLDHFGLTARDLLPDDYPVMDVAALEQAAAVATAPSTNAWDPEVSDLLSQATSIAGGGRAQVLHVLAALLSLDSWRSRLQPGLDRFGFSARTVTEQLIVEGLRTVDLSGPTPAGTQLGTWLARAFPRQPATMASFSNDVPDPGADFVGIAEEADAFAYLIASRTLVPPLALGLFGDWGSGKSFLMAKIRQRVGQLTALAAADPVAEGIWPRVVAIDFNAWQYVETDLWAALLARIFDQLSPQARDQLTRLSAKQRNTARRQTEVAKEIARLTSVERRQVDAASAAMQETGRVKEEVVTVRETAIRTALETHARSGVTSGLVAALGKGLGPEVSRVLIDTQQVLDAARTPAWRQSEFWSRRRVSWVVAALLTAGAVAVLLDRVTSSAPAAVAALVTIAAALAPMLRTAAAFVEGQVRAAAEATGRLESQLSALVADAEQVQEKTEADLATTRDRLAKRRKEENELAAKRVDLDEMAARLQPGPAYTNFLQGRGITDDYRKRLGVVSTVSDDLATLSELVAAYNRDPAAWTPDGPPNRIVLYIDDLDRCPPARVLEVLEAVHLLLAFPLFVVVVAVDTRWLTTALHEALPILQREATPGVAAPTATDYLEKIFQIPFWVEPLDDQARRRLLRGLLLPAVETLKPTRSAQPDHQVQVGERERHAADRMTAVYGQWLDLDARTFTISPAELEFVEALTPLTAGTPRQVKRFVNICKLLLSMSPPLDPGTDAPTERSAACFMAALHQSMPTLAAQLAKAARTSMSAPPAGAGATLDSLLTDLVDPAVSTDVARVRGWLTASDIPAAAPFQQARASMLLKRWDTIKRLRFAEQDGATS